MLDNRFFFDYLLVSYWKVCIVIKIFCCGWVNSLGKDEIIINLEKRLFDYLLFMGFFLIRFRLKIKLRISWVLSFLTNF